MSLNGGCCTRLQVPHGFDRKAQILPRLGLLGQAAQQVRRVISDDQRRALKLEHFVAQTADWRLELEQIDGRHLAEPDDQLRPGQLDLSAQVRFTL